VANAVLDSAAAATTTQSDIDAARQFISSESGDPAAMYALALRLIDQNRFTYAAQLLTVAEQIHREPDALWFNISRKLALCTYKDQDQPLADRLNAADKRLRDLLAYDALPVAQRQSALGTLGGICKQRWRSFGTRAHLEESFDWYKQGAALGLEIDRGYTTLNAAFVVDALADLGRDRSGVLTSEARARRDEADRMRLAIVQQIPDEPAADLAPRDRHWHWCERAEALLGLHRYAEARTAIERARQQPIDNWQREAAARQMADVARLHHDGDEPGVDQRTAFEIVALLLSRDGKTARADVERSMLLCSGKVGLALSGGGFRASLFHIGVLARLAELDVLRHVEVISCVSGGSIIGVHYYLKLQHLLETRDDELTRADYIRLVQETEHEFLAGVQHNIRNTMLLGFTSNWHVLSGRASSMTERLGELYERVLYGQIGDGRANAPRFLQDLRVHPGGNEHFVPKYDNWQRRCKVPVIVLNATTLNTCHSWQFTATFMGEPPSRGINTDIDANDRLRRMYHDEAPLAYRGKIRLGHAVAASACVPGLFDPLSFDGLYEGGFVTKLVDGGVYDNQGIDSLLEQDCTVLLISDASGQTAGELDPDDGRVGVMTRAQNLLMARVREAEWELLSTLSSSSLLRGVMFLHLKKDLDAKPIDWPRCPNPSRPATAGPLTSYGIRRDVQARLAALRTDLDTFSNVEADALMLSGYQMASTEFTASIRTLPVSTEPPVRWRFQGLREIASSPTDIDGLSELLTSLDVGSHLAFKPLLVSPWLGRALMAGIAVVFVAIVAAVWTSWTSPITIDRERVFGMVGIAVAIGLVVFAIHQVMRRTKHRTKFHHVLLAGIVCSAGWLLARIYAALTESLYIRSGPCYARRDYDAPMK